MAAAEYSVGMMLSKVEKVRPSIEWGIMNKLTVLVS